MLRFGEDGRETHNLDRAITPLASGPPPTPGELTYHSTAAKAEPKHPGINRQARSTPEPGRVQSEGGLASGVSVLNDVLASETQTVGFTHPVAAGINFLYASLGWPG